MQISTDVKKFVVITFTGGHHFITEKQNEILKTLNNQSNITINNCVVHCKNIAEILTTEKYYETYPNKQPANQYKNYSSISDTINSFSNERRKRALQSIIKGFEKHFKGREIPLQSQ
ncbi:hypothetical protein KAS79_04205, partial [Candidatus Parcubacteria bacterium]|nr:hypothetical protein [Candidatus Parcubacteria bacterium]